MISWIKNRLRRASKFFYFIHIPKTAGTSFITLLDTMVDEKQIFPAQLWREVNEDMLQSNEEYRLLRGHFGGGCHRQLLDKNAQLLTLLRHPQSLSISTYHFIQREKNTRVHELVMANNMSLEDFLQHPQTQTKVSDRMTRHLSFDLQGDPDAHELFLSEQSVKVVEKWLKKGVVLSDTQRLRRAIQRLRSCQWFGLVEQFDVSMQWFCFLFHRPPLFEAPKLNAYKPSQDVSEEANKLIKALNPMDFELYAVARQLFKDKIQDMQSVLETHRQSSEDSTVQLLDRHYKNHYEQQPKLWQEQVDFEFSQAMLGSGWHRRELAMPEKSSFRWTSHAQSFIDFWLHPGDYTVKIRVINSVDENVLNGNWIAINGDAMDYDVDTTEGVVRVYNFKVTKQQISNGLLRIEFLMPKVIRHSEAFASDDHRELGVAIHWIKVAKYE